MNNDCPAPVWVNNNQQLAKICQHWMAQPVLAVDTEFMRTDTFFPILGLIQVSDGVDCWLIDPLAEMDLSPVKDMLISNNIVKVFHSCSEDLEVLQQTFGVLPEPLFDTQVAAAFAGSPFGCGYNRLLSEVLGIELDKHETRSDWLQRPLTDSQCRYAAEDVYYLFHVYQSISQQLETSGRDAWVAEEMDELLHKARNPFTPETYYQKVKGAWKLSPQQLGVLKPLCQWREQQAIALNRPRGRVVKDNDLLSIAINQPQTLDYLAQITRLHPGQIRRFGLSLLELVKEGQSLSQDQLPEPLPDALPRETRQMFKALRSLIDETAEQTGLPKELLATKLDIEQAIRSIQPGEELKSGRLFQGWRANMLEDQLIQCIRENLVELS